MADTDVREIRPMTLADIIDSAINMYRHNFVPFFVITAVAYVPAVLAQIAMPMMVGALEMTPDDGADPLMIGGVFAIVMGLAWITYAVAIPLAQGALIWAVSRRYLGQSITVRDAYQVVFERFGYILLVIIITGFATGLGTLACIIPGILLWILFTFSVPEVVLNDRTAFDAIRESWDLARYDFWKVVSTLVVLGLLVTVATYALAAPLSFGVMAIPTLSDSLTVQAIAQALSVVVQAALQPVAIIGMILLYYDLRIRRDGFDLQLLAESIESDILPPEMEVPRPDKPRLFSPDGAGLPPRIDESGSTGAANSSNKEDLIGETTEQ